MTLNSVRAWLAARRQGGTDMGTAIVETTAPPPDAEDMVVIANSTEEMQVAQRALVGWADRRVAKLELELVDAVGNLEAAERNGLKKGPWQRSVAQMRKRVEYYTKIRAALEAGYVIMPDIPADVIAIRTTRARVRPDEGSSRWSKNPGLPRQETSAPALGDGRYVSPVPFGLRHDTKTKEADGREVVTHHVTAHSFDDEIDFPIRMVKPRVLDETGRAMALSIFDEIGVLPARARNADPVVLGRVVLKDGRSRKSVAFLITWWLDTRTL